jgi:ABC-type branched-subunit amino acid transport system ATPase component
MPNDESLLDLVFTRLAQGAVPDETASLVLAAYAGDEHLRDALAGGSPGLPEPGSAAGPAHDPLYLETVTVAGFRGVGPQASLRLPPHAGLTLVVGRNGSGKSTFAEAAELTLTGDSSRWAENTSVFREGWRNLHHGSPCQTQVGLRADGQAAPVQITRTWRDGDTGPDDASVSVAAGGTRFGGLAGLGWATPMQTYRPFLTAGDFGRLISSRPSSVFDALAPILGLDPLTAADKRLMAARKDLDDRLRQVNAGRETLRGMLATVDDDRARTALAILTKRRPDLGSLEALLAAPGDSGTDPTAAACRRIADAEVPGAPAVADAAREIDAASAEVTALATSTSRAAEQAGDMLAAALEFHAGQGDRPCPVCGRGMLDRDWRIGAEQSLARMRETAREALAASRRRERALVRARALLAAPGLPAEADVTAAGEALGPSAAGLRAGLAAWQDAGQATPEQLAERLRAAHPLLSRAVTAAREAARGWLRRRHDAWREPSAALQGWLIQARQASGLDVQLARIKAARDWLRDATEEIRAARLAPFAQRSQQVWEQLRQESNVELSGMRLDGSSTRRRVMFPATVDGTATQAMAVMSHGELQALGLAVFLPRACAAESPFRFLLIDDPVHSMDPSKVDGLARVLDTLASTRQVIVFTHDDRLPEAIRRLRIEAIIWEVTRREGSVVELRKNLDPVERYLGDAWALASTADLPEEVRRPVVAGFCRSAIEAACHQRTRRERLGRGERHAAVDRLIENAHTLTQTVALALFGDAAQGRQVLPSLNRRFGPRAGDAFVACQQEIHTTTGVALRELVSDTQRLARGLR